MLKLTRVSKYYTDSDKAACGLREVSLSFERGEFVLITGPSGAGKTTLLNVVSLLDDYDEGNILFCGESTIDAGKEELENFGKNTYPMSSRNRPSWRVFRSSTIS